MFYILFSMDLNWIETTAICIENFSYPALTIGKEYKAKYEDWTRFFNWDNDLFRDYPIHYFEITNHWLDELISLKENLEDKIVDLEDDLHDLDQDETIAENKLDDWKSEWSERQEKIADYHQCVEEYPENVDEKYLENLIQESLQYTELINDKEEDLEEIREDMQSIKYKLEDLEFELEDVIDKIAHVL